MEKDEEDREWKAALETGVRYLARRARSRLEVERRLERAGFPGALIAKVIACLEQRGYLDDESFGRQWARDRLSRTPMGACRLHRELRRRGVEDILARDIAAQLAGGEQEYEMALRAARKKVKMLLQGPPEKVRARLYRFLVARGFGYDLVRRVVEETT